MPRALLFLAAIWLIAAWVRTIGLTPPVQPSSASYEPGVRLLLVMIAIGWTILWPLLRLSQYPSIWPARQTLLDLLVLGCLLQVVLWPVRLLTRWTPERTAAIDLMLLAWISITGALVAVTTGSASLKARTFAMAVLMLPLPAILHPEFRPYAALTGPGVLAREGGAPMLRSEWVVPVVLSAAALLSWIAVACITYIRHRRRSPAPAPRPDDAPAVSPRVEGEE